MTVEIVMPKLSDTMEEGKILRWLKKEGDYVTKGEVIAEIETDKADMELEAFSSGILSKIYFKEGETVSVGVVIAILGEGETGATTQSPQPDSERPETAPDKPPVVIMGETSDEPCCTVTLDEEEEEMIMAQEENFPLDKKKEKPKITPAARKLIEEKGIDAVRLRGGGPAGRIEKKDVEKYIQEMAEAKKNIEITPSIAEEKDKGQEKAIELSKMRATIARRMTKSKQTIPHFYVTREVDMEETAKLITSLNRINESGEKITHNDLLIRSCALALREHRTLNGHFDEQGLVLKEDINIGIVVALKVGLLVPVVRNADRLSVKEISHKVKGLRDRILKKESTPEDLTGGTFTISNMGMFGVEEFSAIINPPQLAILAVAAIKDTPVIKDGEMRPSKIMKITLSADHRALDGVIVARFLQSIKEYLENPVALVL